MLISQDTKYHNLYKKKKRAASTFLQKVTLVSISLIMILFYLLLTGGSSFNKTHRMIGKKWILTFPRAYNITLFLCKIQPSKNSKSCFNILGVSLWWNCTKEWSITFFFLMQSLLRVTQIILFYSDSDIMQIKNIFRNTFKQSHIKPSSCTEIKMRKC